MTPAEYVTVAILCIGLVISLAANFAQYCNNRDQQKAIDDYYSNWCDTLSDRNALRAQHSDVEYEHFVLSSSREFHLKRIAQLEKDVDKLSKRNAALSRRLEKAGDMPAQLKVEIAYGSDRRILRKPHKVQPSQEDTDDTDDCACSTDSDNGRNSDLAETE